MGAARAGRGEVEKGMVNQKARYGRSGIDVRVEVAGLCMAAGTMAMATEPKATGASAELVRMRRQTRIAMQAQGRCVGGWGSRESESWEKEQAIGWTRRATCAGLDGEAGQLLGVGPWFGL